MAEADYDYFKIKIVRDINSTESFIRKISLTDNVADIVSQLCGDVLLLKVYADDVEVLPKIKFHVLKTFGSKIITVHTKPLQSEHPTTQDVDNNNNVFDILMKASRKYESYPSLREEHNEKDRLFNHFVSWLKEKSWGFTPHQIHTTGKHVVSSLTDVMWYLDPFWDRMGTRSVFVPDALKQFTGYRHIKEQKKKLPQLVATELNEHLEKLSEVLMIPWIMNKDMTGLKDIIESLIERVRKYHWFLTGMKERSSANNKNAEPIRGFHDNWILKTVEASTSVIKNEYKALDRALKESDDYMTIDLINFEPSDKEDRRKWLQHLEVSVSVNVYTSGTVTILAM